jgi:mannose-6-phosphate isomerase-like protein (cupin superfamily)
MLTLQAHQPAPLQLCFVGPNNLLVIKKGDSAVIVNKQPVKYIKQLSPSNARPTVKVNDGPVNPNFVAKEFLLSPGEHSNRLLEFYCHKYWVVLSGTAWITVDNVTRMIKQQQGVLIPPMQEHRIYNTTTEPLRFVEVCASESLSGKEQIQFIDNPV